MTTINKTDVKRAFQSINYEFESTFSTLKIEIQEAWESSSQWERINQTWIKDLDIEAKKMLTVFFGLMKTSFKNKIELALCVKDERYDLFVKYTAIPSICGVK